MRLGRESVPKMSVLLTACRHSKQRAIERAMKKRAEKARPAAYGRLKKEAELQQLEDDDPFADDVSKCWSFLVNGAPYTVVLYLASGKDTVDVFVNDMEVENRDVMTNVSSDGITFDFLLGQVYKARISCTGNPHSGMIHTLSIDGYPVPE